MENKLEWTIIIQLNPSTDLFGYCESVFNDLKKLPVSDKVKVIVVLSSLNSIQRSDSKSSHIDFSQPIFYEMSPTVSMFAPNLDIVVDDLVDPSNMVTFFNKIKSDFTAEKYCYVVKDHGSGSAFSLNNSKYIQKIVRYKGNENDIENLKEYFSKQYKINGYQLEDAFTIGDDGSNVYMLLFSIDGVQNAQTIKNFALASKEAVIKWDVFCMDCCWAQMLENSYNMKDAAKYNVACQDEGPIKGFDMNINIETLINNPNTKSEEFAKYICTSFYSSNYLDYTSSEDFKNIGICISVLDNNKSEKIISELNSLVKCLNKLLTTELTISKFIKARMFCEDYMYDSGTEYKEPRYSVFTIDLVHFLENLIFVFPSENDLVNQCNKIIKIVLCHFSKINVTNNYVDFTIGKYTKDRPQAKGVSFYFPVQWHNWNSDIYEDSPTKWFEKECDWANFLKDLLKNQLYQSIIAKVLNKEVIPIPNQEGDFILNDLLKINESRNLLWSNI